MQGVLMTIDSIKDKQVPFVEVTVSTRNAMNLDRSFLKPERAVHRGHGVQLWAHLGKQQASQLPKQLLHQQIPNIDQYSFFENEVSECQKKVQATGDSFFQAQAAQGPGGTEPGSFIINHSSLDLAGPGDMPGRSPAAKRQNKRRTAAAAEAPVNPPQLVTPDKRRRVSSAESVASGVDDGLARGSAASCAVSAGGRPHKRPKTLSDGLGVDIQKVLEDNYLPGREIDGVGGLAFREQGLTTPCKLCK